MLVITDVRTRPQAACRGKSRVYFWPEGESVMDNFRNRRARPHTEYRKLIVEAFAQAGIDATALSARWSQKAGCTCPCSPGFVMSQGLGVDLHVAVAVAQPALLD